MAIRVAEMTANRVALVPVVPASLVPHVVANFTPVAALCTSELPAASANPVPASVMTKLALVAGPVAGVAVYVAVVADDTPWNKPSTAAAAAAVVRPMRTAVRRVVIVRNMSGAPP